MLVEGAATAAAYAIASGLADGGRIDVNALVGSGRLAAELRPWLARVLANLAAAGLAKRRNDQWQVIKDPLMPSAASVIQELAAQHPDRAAEIFVLGAIAGLAERVKARHAIAMSPESASVGERARFLRRCLRVAPGIEPHYRARA